MKKILVTGATGIVGNELLQMFHSDKTIEVTGVSAHGDKALNVGSWRMGVKPVPPMLRETKWDVVIHAAASIKWNLPADAARVANVKSTEALADVLSEDTRLIHVSTAYAAGLRGSARSEDVDDYRNTYEWSKAAAERAAIKLGCSWIVRPPLIIGSRTQRGCIARFIGVYQLLHGVMVGALPALVGAPESLADMVPVDDLARLIVDLVDTAERPSAPILLRIGRGGDSVSVERAMQVIFAALNEWRAANGQSVLDAIPIVSPDTWNRFFRPFADQHMDADQRRMIRFFDPFQPYWSLNEALPVDVCVDPIEETLTHCITHWAERNPSIASQTPLPWPA